MKTISAATLPASFRSQFLEELTPTEVRAVLAVAKKEIMLPRQILQQQGDSASRFFLLIEGRVVAYRLAEEGCKVFLRWGVPGDAFGLATSLKERSRYLVTVEAVQEGTFLTWDLAASRNLIAQFPNVIEAAYSVAARYMDDFIEILSVRAFKRAPQRLAQMLIKSASQIGRLGPDGIELDLTNEQLAVAAHVSLFTASRQLSKWRALGIVRKKRGRIVLPSLSRLDGIFNDGRVSRSLR